MKPLNFAHRGYSGKYPENTMLAFHRAITEGSCDGLEIDVQLTLDGEPVVIHDTELLRTTHSHGMVYEFSFRALRTLNAAAQYEGTFPVQRIPHLSEVLSLVRQYNILLNIELKNYEIPYLGMEQKVIRLIEQEGLENQIILSSFNHISMVTCKEMQPAIQTGLLYAQPLYNPEEYCKLCGANALHAPLAAMKWDPHLATRCKQSGIAVNMWTANTQEEMEKAIAFGADYLITNYPNRLEQLLQGEG